MKTPEPAKGEAMPKTGPTDREIVRAMDDVLADVQQLRRAAMILDDFASNEFRNGRTPGHLWAYGITEDQVSGITYLTNHVRDLALDLERAIDKAFGLEE